MTTLVNQSSNLGITTSASLPAWLDRAAYPFTLRRLRVPAGVLSYVDEGEGEPLLLVHGTPVWSFDFRRLISELSRTHRVIAFDNLGFGLSERPRDFAYTPEAHADNLRQAVDALGLTDFTLLAHDFGGPIGLPLVFDPRYRVRRVVLFNTWMWPFDDDPELARAARVAGSGFGRFLYRYFNASLRLLTPASYADRRKLTKEIHRQYLAPFADWDSRERVLWALARSLLGSRAHYAALWQQRAALQRLPVLIIWGEKDTALPARLLTRWREALPDAQVLSLPDSGHFPHEEEPERVVAAIQTFLAVP